MQLMQE